MSFLGGDLSVHRVLVVSRNDNNSDRHHHHHRWSLSTGAVGGRVNRWSNRKRAFGEKETLLIADQFTQKALQKCLKN